ncbi:MAG: HNH endonuclease family protein [Coriobacteriales bacterium]|jgi:hypothetical protein|nr:HNH endonuclease family protein [Coriobacteriales bacterium]
MMKRVQKWQVFLAIGIVLLLLTGIAGFTGCGTSADSSAQPASSDNLNSEADQGSAASATGSEQGSDQGSAPVSGQAQKGSEAAAKAGSGKIPAALKNEPSLANPYSSKKQALAALAKVKVAAASEAAYNRAKMYGAFATIYGAWSVRDFVLSQSAHKASDDGGKYTSGKWYDPYANQWLTCKGWRKVASGIQIDHIIPLAYVNAHGGASWSQDKREEYANDCGVDNQGTNGDNSSYDYANYDVLVAVDASANLQKSDQGPAEWLPVNQGYRYIYACKWVQIARGYGISVTRADYNELKSLIKDGQSAYAKPSSKTLD